MRSREKTTIKMGRSAKRNVRKDKGDEKWRGTAVPTGSTTTSQSHPFTGTTRKNII